MPFGIKPESEEQKNTNANKKKEVLKRYTTIFSIWSTVKPDKKLENHRESLLKRCREKNLKLNKKKAKFRMTEVKFMEQILTADGFRPAESKVTAIRNIQIPKNVAEIQRSLGCANCLARFLPKVSDTAKPLRDLTCEKNQWQKAKAI